MRALVLFFLLVSYPAVQGEPQLTEEEKITRLIDYVRNMKDCSFIRNGKAHTPAEAADHLAMKRKKAGKKISNARDFIYHIASKSSVTGEVYKVRYSDGSEKEVKNILLFELAKMEKE